MKRMTFVIAALTWAMAQRPAFAATEHVIELKQKHRVYGQVIVQIASNAVKIESPRGGFTFLCAAPQWDAILYNEKRKLINRRKFSDWSVHGLKTALCIEGNEQYFNWPKLRVGNMYYKGDQAVRFEYPFLSHGRPIDLKRGNCGVYMLAEDVKMTDNINKFILALYDLPPAEGMPLYFSRVIGASFGFGLAYNKKAAMGDVLVTTDKIERGIAVDVAQFKVPSGFKTVAEGEIMVSSSQMDDTMKDLWGN